MTDQHGDGATVSLGRWKVTDSLGGEVPKKAIVELIGEPDALAIHLADSTIIRAGYAKAWHVDITGARAAAIHTERGVVWFEQVGSITPADLKKELAARRPPPAPEPEPGPIAVFSYPGRTQADAAKLFASHAQEMADKGYRPISQSWGEGRPGAGRIWALGELSTAIRPNGFLTVTYEKRESMQVESSPAPPAPDPIDQIRRLGELRDAGFITHDEFETKKAELLARM